MSFKAKRVIGGLLAATLAVTAGAATAVVLKPALVVEAASSVSITKGAGWYESAYIQWSSVSGAAQYKVYVKGSSGSYTQLDDPLIRSYGSYWRADAVGLAPGSYTMKVDALNS